MNAIAHTVEALYALDRNPIVSLMADAAIDALARALPAIVARPDDREARALRGPIFAPPLVEEGTADTMKRSAMPLVVVALAITGSARTVPKQWR